MKYFVLVLLVFFTNNALANYFKNIKPYIGIDMGLNFADYNYNTDLDDIYFSVSANAGLRINKNLGLEIFFTQSSTNKLNFISENQAQNHEFYYQAIGFDLYGFYNLYKDFDFFTTVGVARYYTFNKYECVGITNYSDKISVKNTTSRFGIGFIYNFPYNNLHGIIKYNFSPINNNLIKNLSEISLGFKYVF